MDHGVGQTSGIDKEDPPEKPLELDTTTTSEGTGTAEKKKHTLKLKNPFSIFGTKSTRQNMESEVVAPTAPLKEVFGQGDTIVRRIPAVFIPQYPTKPATPVGSPEKVAETPKPVAVAPLATRARSSEKVAEVPKPMLEERPSTSTKFARNENVRVDVHKVGTPEGHQNPIHQTVADNKSGGSRSQSRERRKGVTICESQEKVTVQYHQPTQHFSQSSRRSAKKYSGSSSGGPRKISSQIEKPTIKVDARTLRKKYKHLLSLVDELTELCEYYKNELRNKESNQDVERIRHRKETEVLNKQIYRLGEEVDAWKEECQKMENKSTALIKVKNLSQENSDLRADIDVQKSVIVRLNKELAHYQDKFRVKYKDTPENIPMYSSSADTDADSTFPEEDWLQHPRKCLLPLLIAYDEVIEEQKELLKDHEMVLDRFKGRLVEIVQENDALHQLISSNKDKGSISIEEWEFLRSNAVIVLEENDLLHEQVDNLKKKEEKLFATFQVKAAEFKQTITQHETEIRRQKSIIASLEERCKKLSEEHATMAANVHARIPREKHEAMVQEFKRAFDELKAKYEADKKVICDKLEAAEKERESLVEEAANLENENTHLRRDFQDCEKNLAATKEALEQMKTSLLETTSAREATNGMIEDFVKHIQQLAAEKNKLVEDLNQQRLLNEQIMTLRSKENDLVKQLHDKIEAMERLHNDEVKSVQGKVKELEEALKTKSERHRRESLQLHELLEEKDRRIEAIEESKKQLQQDLETVWRTTTTTMNASLKNRNV